MYTIIEVMERLGLKSRKSIYDWAKVCGVVPQKIQGKGATSYFTDADIDAFLKVKEYLADGGKLDKYVITDVLEVDLSGGQIVENETAPRQLELFAELIEAVATTVTSKINNTIKSPIKHWKELLFACENELLLTTDEIKAIIGVKPKGSEFKRGTFVFKKHGKIGRETAWQCQKDKL